MSSTPDPRKISVAAIAGWLLFDWAAQPFHTLLTTFIYSPYFANAVASDPVRGQAMWGYATAAAGIVLALSSPILGAIADASGRRKPWIAAFGVIYIVATACLWFGKPGDAGSIPIVLISFAIAMLAIEFAAVFNNAMMPTLVPAERLGRLSGNGWALGYAGGIVSLALMLCLLVANPVTGKTLAGISPWFGFDPALREGDRASGPFSAIWFIIFIVPLFLFTPDQPARTSLKVAVKTGIATLKDSLRRLRGERDITFFLLANMIYADGLVALFAFGGIFAVSVFGWSTTEVGIFGIVILLFGVFGAWLGGKADDRFGAKPVILTSLTLLLFAVLAVLSTGADFIGPFAVPPPTPNDGLFAAPAEKAYLAIGMLIGLVSGPLQAASRTFLVRLAPPDRVTQFFGLLALSGRVTSFLGPLSVAAVTQIFMSQRAGLAVLTLFFGAGLILLWQVRTR